MDKHDVAVELAEEALDAALHGDQKKSEELLEESRELDPTAIEEVSHAHQKNGDKVAH
jgi:hypothetical protein